MQFSFRIPRIQIRNSQFPIFYLPFCLLPLIPILWTAIFLFASQASAQNVAFTINASIIVDTISERLYGANLEVGDAETRGTNADFKNMMLWAGIKHFRWPGGTTGDGVLWSNLPSTGASYSQSLGLLADIGGVMQPIVNFFGYWNGVMHTEQEAIAAAAGLVRDHNIDRRPGAKYWEIGNECYGPWEVPDNPADNNGILYGTRFCKFYDAMKAIDPTIKIGAVVTPPFPFDTLFNRFSIRALDTIAKLRHAPDFLIVHIYPYIQMDQYSSIFGLNMLPAGPSQLKDTLTTGRWIDLIPSSVDTLNKWVTACFGASNPGKIEYFFTEYSTGSYTTQNQTQAVSAQWIAQAWMEFARLGIRGSNSWRASYYYANGNPTWYIYPMFIFHYGKYLVATTRTTTDSRIRAWAARDTVGNLTMFLANNSVGGAIDTAEVTLQGVSAGAVGERWTMTTAGSGNWPPQRTAISINGARSPSAGSIRTLAGESIAAGNPFRVPLPPYSMTWLRIPINNVGIKPNGASIPQRLIIRQTGPGDLLVKIPVGAAREGSWTLQIHDIAGRTVWRGMGKELERTISMGITAPGIYLYTVRVNNRRHVTAWPALGNVPEHGH
jgi:hypothetical protein